MDEQLKAEIREFLKAHMSIKVTSEDGSIEVMIYLDDDLICDDYDYISRR